MNGSLCVMLPFRNAEHVALTLIPEYIEVCSELPADWEIVAIDDGSQDATPEILCELAQIYPQLRVATTVQPRGFYNALCTALSLSQAYTLFIPLRYRLIPLDAMHRLWAAAQKHALVVGIPSYRTEYDEIECLMLHRSLASPIFPALSSPDRLAQVISRFETDAVVVTLGHASDSSSAELASRSLTMTTSSGPEILPRPPKSLTLRAARDLLQRIKRFAAGSEKECVVKGTR